MNDEALDLVVIDRASGKEFWTSENAAHHCQINPASWRHYHRLHQTPEPVTRLGNLPLWDADEVKQWQANRLTKPRKKKSAAEK